VSAILVRCPQTGRAIPTGPQDRYGRFRNLAARRIVSAVSSVRSGAQVAAIRRMGRRPSQARVLCLTVMQLPWQLRAHPDDSRRLIAPPLAPPVVNG
jgi:hypothetical protein